MRVSTRDVGFIKAKGGYFVNISGSRGTAVLVISKALAFVAGVKDKAIVEYDDSSKTIFIRPIATTDEGAVNVKNRQIGATAFFRYAGISPDKGRYKAFYDPKAGEIVIKLA